MKIFLNKIPDNSKYITTKEYNKLMAESFTVRLRQVDLVSKADFDNKLTSFNKRNYLKQNKKFRSSKEN